MITMYPQSLTGNNKRERKKYIARLLLALIMTTILYRAIAVFCQSPVDIYALAKKNPELPCAFSATGVELSGKRLPSGRSYKELVLSVLEV